MSAPLDGSGQGGGGGFGGPPGPMGPGAPPQQQGYPLQQQGFPPQPQGFPPQGYGQAGYGAAGGPVVAGPPAWVGIVARVFLGLGILLIVGTVVGGIMSEELGMNLAMAAVGPFGFGLTATLLTRKTSTGGAGKPLGIGCAVGFLLSLALVVFFTAIWPSL